MKVEIIFLSENNFKNNPMITTPTLFIDVAKCKANIKKMFLKAQEHQLDFRPHFKTHQSLTIGQWFKELGVSKITVSSLSMANYFSAEWNDITVAFPTNVLEIKTINELAKRITLNLAVESMETLSFLTKNGTANVNVFLKIDVEYHRTGINPNEVNLIDEMLEHIDKSSLVNFKGFLGHAGHSYQCRSEESIKKVHHIALTIMSKLKSRYGSQYPNLIISLGDTPCCSVAEDFSGVDEIRPGNFVFYDLTQNRIGSNTISQIAVALACPIVAIHKERAEVVIYGGGVHLSKERLSGEQEGTIYGRVVEKLEKGWGDIIPDVYVTRLSQEHGIISVPNNQIEEYKVGDYLMVLPIHSCMTANLMKSYTTLEGITISRL